ncbi:MAG: glyoxalase superfamily protein [Flavobacteriaceae bacterium]
MRADFPTLDELKSQARSLRGALAEAGTDISHSHSLELVARQRGYRDWNTLHAAVGNAPPPIYLTPGERVQGRYLGQPFAGRILSVALIADGAFQRITLEFDEPVDVVKFDSFSAFRRRVSATIDETGVTAARTSDGEPHLRLRRA